MNKGKKHSKIAFDLFAAQGGWTVWFLGIVTIIQIIKTIISIKTGSTQEDFFVSSFVSNSIYMFVIGIIAAYAFLPFFVKNGVTRKDYYKGAILAVIGLSFALLIFSLVIAGIEHGIMKIAHLPMVFDNSSAELLGQDEGDGLIAMIVKMIVVSPYVSLEANWLVSIVLAYLNMISHYVIGWLIGAGYYRHGWIAGFGYIAMSIVFMMGWDLLWGSEMGEPLSSILGVISFNIPVLVSIIGSILIIAFVLWIIRILTRKAVVKF